jgi:hypothetical protein
MKPEEDMRPAIIVFANAPRSMCRYCSRLARQLKALRRAAWAVSESDSAADAELEERLLRKLDIHP